MCHTREGDMRKCVRLQFTVGKADGFLQNVVLHEARECRVEGSGQMVAPDKVRIVACGDTATIDAFIDALLRHTIKHELGPVEMEPMLKDKDYRMIFRVIE